MTLSHPDLASFFNSLNAYLPDYLTSGALAGNYILGGKNRFITGQVDRMNNAIRAFEGPLSRILCMMEDDLKGLYLGRNKERNYPRQPPARDGKFFFRDKAYDGVTLCPLLMDFTRGDGEETDTAYYPIARGDRIRKYAEDTIRGIEEYHESRPDGLLEIQPFLGITPAAHSLRDMEKLLDTYINTSHSRKSKGKKLFRGLKFYPPLGFDAWPQARKERMKMEAIYEFCATYAIPTITHCDDQGFRTLPSKKAWNLTEPNHYRPVLERYPQLIIDFAHFGYRYSMQGASIASLAAKAEGLPSSPWFTQIVDMMEVYPNVYTDFSFSGVHPVFYAEVVNFLNTLPPERRSRLTDRMMFGTDFSVNLFMIESYLEYYEIFEESAFPDEEIEKFVDVNPQRFLALPEIE